ncbi:HAMP domain-containing sensor histidine kinase [Halobellus captivus]|nr:HAMP domain-containing sensor histidine kinase [Halobellus captivus]
MAATGSPMSILLVGSDADAAGSVAAGLEGEDDRLRVDPIADVDGTIERVANGSDDAVVAVLDRPEEGGLRLVERLRARDPELPVVLYADGGTEDAAAEALAAGATDYVRTSPSIEGYVLLARRVTSAVESARAIREAERRRDRLERFVEVVSHDLRNPLNVAQGRLDLARGECDSEHLEPAADAVDRSLALVADLLTLAREGRTVSRVERVTLADAVEESWASVETGDATLVVDPEADREIRGHPGRTRQLLENLLGNAVRHGGDGVTVRVEIVEPMYTTTRAVDGGGAGFYVADDGPGIPKNDRKRVFETGYTTATDGTGFGLNIAKEIAEAHGWEIRATASREGGTRIEVTGVDVVG